MIASYRSGRTSSEYASALGAAHVVQVPARIGDLGLLQEVAARLATSPRHLPVAELMEAHHVEIGGAGAQTRQMVGRRSR